MADRTLTRTLVRGTSAERAAYTPYPPPAITEHDTGYVFYETDTGTLQAWDGAAWQICNRAQGNWAPMTDGGVTPVLLTDEMGNVILAPF